MTPTALIVQSKDELLESVADLDGMPLAVSLADLDRFADLNHTHGHEVGDKVLRAFERTLTGSLPKGCRVGRVGGDEYAIVLPDHTAETALIVLEEIRAHFSSHYPCAEVTWRVNCSFGVAARPPHGPEIGKLLQSADEALARAKREGKSRVAIYVEERMTLKSNYYSKADLDRLGKLSEATGRTEASLLREALADVFEKYRDQL